MDPDIKSQSFRSAALALVLLCFFPLDADTIVDIDKSVATGVWAKEHSPYIVTGSGSIENLEIQSGVTVQWNVGSVMFSKGYFRLSGSEHDSIVFVPGGAFTRITVYSLQNQAREFHAAFTRFSGVGFALQNRDSLEFTLQNCLLDSCILNNAIARAIRFRRSSFIHTEMSLSDERECVISGCDFRDHYELSLTAMGKILIDSCFFIGTRYHALKFVADSQITVKNCIFDNCSGYQGAAIALDGGNKHTVICDNVFSRNTVTNIGGAVVSFGRDTVIMIGNIFAHNSAANTGGGAFLQGGWNVLVNNLFTRNSSGLTLSGNPATLVNTVFMQNGTVSDSIQIHFNDSMVTKSAFYNCCIESGIEKCKFPRYRVGNTTDSITASFSGIDSAAITMLPLFVERLIPNRFGYVQSLPVFPARGSSVINNGKTHEYFTTLCPADLLGTSWTADGAVDAGAIQWIDNNLNASARQTTFIQPKIFCKKRCDLLGRTVGSKRPCDGVVVNDGIRIMFR